MRKLFVAIRFMKTSRVILICCAVLLLTNILTGCATTQRDPAAALPTSSDAMTYNPHTEPERMWEFVEFLSMLGWPFWANH
jgi:hypothetical protein